MYPGPQSSLWCLWTKGNELRQGISGAWYNILIKTTGELVILNLG